MQTECCLARPPPMPCGVALPNQLVLRHPPFRWLFTALSPPVSWTSGAGFRSAQKRWVKNLKNTYLTVTFSSSLALTPPSSVTVRVTVTIVPDRALEPTIMVGVAVVAPDMTRTTLLRLLTQE